MEQPEVKPRHGVVVARIAQVQEPQHVLVDEVEPEEAAVVARLAAQSEIEVGRIAKRGQHVPGRGNHREDQSPRHGAQALPGAAGEQLAGEEQVQEARRRRESPGRSIPSAAAHPQTGGQQRGPQARARLALIQRAQERPQGHSDGQRQDDVGNQNAGEQEQAGAGGQGQPGMESRPAARRPRRRSGP